MKPKKNKIEIPKELWCKSEPVKKELCFSDYLEARVRRLEKHLEFLRQKALIKPK